METSKQAIKGTLLELEDCAFTTLFDMSFTVDSLHGFTDSDYVIMLGAKPRGPGMERKDLLRANAGTFEKQGQALNQAVAQDAHILVVGNPANTNALIALKNAPDLPASAFSALTQLDHIRGKSMLARTLNCHPDDVKKITIWGNHSSTQFVDISHATIADCPALKLVEEKWWQEILVPSVQQRGAKVIKTRGASSAGSAANAVIQHIRTLHFGSPSDDWSSMAVLSDGSYDIPPDLVFSFPVTSNGNKDWQIVQGLELSEYAKQQLQITAQELCEERDIVASFLK